MGQGEPRILVVDDDAKNVKLLNAILQAEGYRCESAFSGQEAIGKVKTNPPDLILLDIMMPEVDGYEVCKLVKETPETKDIPVVMVTALTEKEEKIRSLDLGADDFITKPIDKIELLARIRSLLRIKQYQDELKKNLQQLEKQNREIQQLMEERRALVNMIIHDLKTPITGIQGYLEVALLDRTGLDDRRVQLLEKALLCCSELDLMISNILALEKSEESPIKLNIEPVNIKVLLREALSIYSFKIKKKNLKIDVIANETVMIYADANLLKRVIYNLLDNAIKNAAEDSGITIEINYNAEEQQLEFAITTEGTILRPEHKEKIFEMFQQADNKILIGSYGIGLAFCRFAIQMHGGRIWAETSNNAKGCTFKFFVPDRKIQ